MSSRRRDLRFVVVEGPIGVGKTTLARRLSASLGGALLREQAEENPFLRRFYQDPKGYALGAQLFFLLQRARQMQELRQADLFTPLWVADFLIDKDRLFAQLTLDDDELHLYEQIYGYLTVDAPLPDLVIYLQASVPTLLQRIERRGIDYEQRIDGDYLGRLSEAYLRLFHAYDRAPLLIVNTEGLDLASGERDYALVLEQVRRHRHGRQFVNVAP